MKILKLLIIALWMFSVSFFWVSAASVNWNDLEIESSFNTTDRKLSFTAFIDKNIIPDNNYFLWVKINRTSERVFFQNNSESQRLEAGFIINGWSLKSSYPYILTVVDEKGNEQYMLEWTLYFDKNSNLLIVPAHWNKVSTTNSNTTDTSTNSWVTQSISAIVESLLKKAPSQTTQRNVYIAELIIRIWEISKENPKHSDLLQDVISELQDEIWVWSKTTSKKAYWIYAKKSDEPTRINGIGNHPDYKSWRGK